MNTMRILIAALLCVGAAVAQDADQDNDRRIRGPVELQEALSLTDTQVQQLRDNNWAMEHEMRPIAREIGAKQRELRRETRAESPNEAIVGTVTMEIAELQEQLQAIREAYQATAKGFLNFEQLFALQPIESAAEHAYEVRQAAQVNLIFLPEPDNRRDDNRRDDNRRRQPQRR